MLAVWQHFGRGGSQDAQDARAGVCRLQGSYLSVSHNIRHLQSQLSRPYSCTSACILPCDAVVTAAVPSSNPTSDGSFCNAGASTALSKLQGFDFYGKSLRIAYCKSKSDAVAKEEGTFVPKHKRKAGEGASGQRQAKKITTTPEASGAAPAPAPAAARSAPAAAAPAPAPVSCLSHENNCSLPVHTF